MTSSFDNPTEAAAAAAAEGADTSAVAVAATSAAASATTSTNDAIDAAFVDPSNVGTAQAGTGAEEEFIHLASNKNNFNLNPPFHSGSQIAQQQQQDRDSFETFASVPLSGYDEIRDAFPTTTSARNDTYQNHRHRLIMSKIRVNKNTTSSTTASSSKNEEKTAAKNRWLKKSHSVRKMKNNNGSSRRKSGQRKSKNSANTATTTSQRLLGLSLGRSNVTISNSCSGDESHQSDEKEIHETLLGHENNHDHPYNYGKDGSKHTDGADDDIVDGFRIVPPHCPTNDANIFSTTTGKNTTIAATTNTTTTSSVDEDGSGNKNEKDDDFFSNDNSFDRVELLESTSSEEVESSQSSSSSNDPPTLPVEAVGSSSHQNTETAAPTISSSYLRSVNPKEECVKYEGRTTKEDNDEMKEQKSQNAVATQSSTFDEDQTEGKGYIRKPSLVVKTGDGVVAEGSKSLEKRPWSPPAIHSVKVEKTVCTFQDRLKFYQSKSKADTADIPGRDVEEENVDLHFFGKEELVQVVSQPTDVLHSGTHAKKILNQNYDSNSQNVQMNNNNNVSEENRSSIEIHQRLNKKNSDETAVDTNSFNFAALRARLQSTTNNQTSTNGKIPFNNHRSKEISVENDVMNREENHVVEQEQQIHEVQESSQAKSNNYSPAMVARYLSHSATPSETRNLVDLETVDENGKAPTGKINSHRSQINKSDDYIDGVGAAADPVNVQNETFSFSDRLKKFEVGGEKDMGEHFLPSTPKYKSSDDTEGKKMTRRGTLLSVKRPENSESNQNENEVQLKALGRRIQEKFISDYDHGNNNVQPDDCNDDNDDEEEEDDESVISDRRQTLKSMRPMVQSNPTPEVKVKQSQDPGVDNDNNDQNSKSTGMKKGDAVRDPTNVQNYNSRKRFFEMLATQKGGNTPVKPFTRNLSSAPKVDKTPIDTFKSADREVLDQISSNAGTSGENSRDGQDDDHPLYVTIQDDDVSSICYSVSDFHPVVCKPTQNLAKYMRKFDNSAALDKETKHTATTSATDSSASSGFKTKNRLNSYNNFSNRIHNRKAEEMREEKRDIKTNKISNFEQRIDKAWAKESWRWQNKQSGLFFNTEGSKRNCNVAIDLEKQPQLTKVCEERNDTSGPQRRRQNMAASPQRIKAGSLSTKTSESQETQAIVEDGQQNLLNLTQSGTPKTQESTSTHRVSTSFLERCAVFQKPSRPKQSLVTRQDSHLTREKKTDHDVVASSVNPDSSIPTKDLASANLTKNNATPKRYHQARKTSQKRSISLKDVLDSKRDSLDPTTCSQATIPRPELGGLSVEVNFSEGVQCDSNVRPSELLNRRKRVSPKQDLPSPLITRRGFSSMIRSPRSSKGSKAPLRCF